MAYYSNIKLVSAVENFVLVRVEDIKTELIIQYSSHSQIIDGYFSFWPLLYVFMCKNKDYH